MPPSVLANGMVYYTYAFLPAPSPSIRAALEQFRGLSNPIAVVTAEAMAAAVEPLEDLKHLQDNDEVLLRSALRHDQVICQMFALTPVLPLRFGTCFISHERLLGHLIEHQSEYHRALAGIAGRGEYLLKAFVQQTVPSRSQQGGSGTAYLLAKRQEFLRQQQQQQQIERAQADLEQLWPPEWPQVRLDAQGSERLRRFFLLDPAQHKRSQQLTQDWLERHPEWNLEWSTALPPYHFAQIRPV